MRIRFGLVLLSTTAMSLAASYGASAGPLGLDEFVEEVAETVEDVTEEVGETVENVVEDTEDVVEEVDEVVDPVEVAASVEGTEVRARVGVGDGRLVVDAGQRPFAVAANPSRPSMVGGASAPTTAMMPPPGVDQCPTVLAHPGAYSAEQVEYCQLMTVGGEPLTIEVAEERCAGQSFVVVPLLTAQTRAHVESETVASTIAVLSDAGSLAQFNCACSPNWCTPNLKGIAGPVLLTYGVEAPAAGTVDPIVTGVPIMDAPGVLVPSPEAIAVAYPPPPPLTPTDPIAALIVEDSIGAENLPAPMLTPVAPAPEAVAAVAPEPAGPSLPAEGLDPIAAATTTPRVQTTPAAPAATPSGEGPSLEVAAVTTTRPADHVPPLESPPIAATVPDEPTVPEPAPPVVALAVPEGPPSVVAPEPTLAAPRPAEIVAEPASAEPPLPPLPIPRPAVVVQATRPSGIPVAPDNINRNGLWRPEGARGLSSTETGIEDYAH